MNNCIEAVCDLAGCKPDRLPSKSTLANMMVESKAMSHLQIAECVPVFETNAFTLMEPPSLVKNMAVFK